jgi:hypothetical protein
MIESLELINLRILYDVGIVCATCAGGGNPLPRIITPAQITIRAVPKIIFCPAERPPPSKRRPPPATATKYIPVTADGEHSNNARLGQRKCRRYKGQSARNEADKDIQYVLPRGGAGGLTWARRIIPSRAE